MLVESALRRFWPRLLIGSVVVWGVLAGLGELDRTGRWRVPILIAVIVAVVAVELTLFRAPLRAAVRSLGLGRPDRRSIIVAAIVSGLILLVFPVARTVTGTRFELAPDWAWLLIGLFVFNGVAEEIVWRAFIFRRLQQGRSFRAAVGWSMPFVAAAHLPILFTNGPVVALGALAVAAITSIPLSHLYLMGGRTIWAPALVHAAIDSFKLMIIPAVAAQTFSLLLIAFSLLVPLTALLVRSTADRPGRR